MHEGGEDQGKGILNTILEDGSQILCDFGKPFLLHPATFPLALCLIFLYHLHACTCFEKKPASEGGWPRAHCLKVFVADRSNRAWWEAWVVLHIYYSESRPAWTREFPFALSATIIVAETCLFYLIRACVDNADDKRRLGSYMKQNARFIHNRYMDFSYKFQRTFLYFWVQCALMCYFVYWLNQDAETKRLENVSILKWFIAAALTVTAGEQEEVGCSFHISYWKMLLRSTGKDEKVVVDNDRCWRGNLYVRVFMDLIVNGINRTLLMALAPVALCVEHNTIDFIKDALALFFITKLDDISGRKRLDECMEDIEEEERDHDKDLDTYACWMKGRCWSPGDRYAKWMKAWRAELDRERKAKGVSNGDNERFEEGDNEAEPLNNGAE